MDQQEGQTRWDDNSDSFLGESRADNTNLLEEVADSYFIQKEEEQLRSAQKLKLEYYFDSFDVINLVQGAMGYETGLKFDRDALVKDERKNSVYALAFSGFFETIHMLPPHRLEFIEKLDKFHFFFRTPKSRDEFKKLYQEVLYALKLGERESFRSLNASNIDDFIQRLLEKGGDLFKANYLLREYTWARRFKYLMKNEILKLDRTKQEVARMEDSKLFQLIKETFDRIRPEFPKNNYYDALSFYFLQKKLEKYKEHPRKEALPVFYASSHAIKGAIRDIRNVDPKLFAYSLNNKQIPIVRDTLFFILEAVFTIGDHTVDFFKDLQDAKDGIRTLVHKEYERYYNKDQTLIKGLEYARKQFEDKVRDIINVKFVQEIWIKEKAYQQLLDELKSIYTLEEKDLPIVEEKIQETLEEALADAKIDLDHSRKLSAIIDNFQSVTGDIRKSLGNVPSSDVFRDFALMKFGLDSRKLPHLQDRIQALTSYKPVQVNYPPAIYDVISSLMTQPANEEESKQFLSALTVAWLLDKHHLIVTLCTGLNREDLKKRYETALIYAASLITIRRNKSGIDRTQEIINCVLSHTDENYKVWLGVGFLYFQLWESKTTLKPDLPEVHLEAWKNQRKSRDYKNYVLNGAIKYATMAYDYLKKQKKKKGQKDSFQLQNFLYALNNVVYYTTKCGSKEEFSALSLLSEELESYPRYPEWQGRFYDTLGWYYLRKFFNTTDPGLRQVFLKAAEQNCEAAISRGGSPREYSLYTQLDRAIIRAKENAIEKGEI